jgi:4-diphosphocytidyl-2-C-methyl-D-erythritol kinase
MRVPAPAKINLHLRVGPRRADGYHPLLTWMTTVALFDTLTFVRRRRRRPRHGDHADASSPPPPPPPGRDAAWFTLSCNDPRLSIGEGNLIVKAATALADDAARAIGSRDGEGRTERSPDRVSAFLNKRIPTGAGLGGGSSDAASTLIGLNGLWKLGFAASRLGAIAATLGSDVPFFLSGPSSICTGRGEIVRPVASLDMKWATLMLPRQIEMPTPAVYRRFDEMNLGREDAIRDEPDWQAWSKLNSAELMPRLVNDLEPAAFALRPELGELRSKLEAALSQVVRMSGSGSSLFTLCDDAETAESHAKRVKESVGVDAIAVALAPPAVMLG